MKKPEKRAKKKGFVYLLLSDKGVFKFGCTTLTPEQRCKAINYRAKEYGQFEVVDSFKSKDIFRSETLVKWQLWGAHLCTFSEYFYCPEVDEVFGAFRHVSQGS